MLFGILDRYIGRSIFATIMMTLFMLVSLSGVIKFVDQLRKVGDGDYSVFAAAVYTLFSAPQDIQIFFPMAVLLGALLGLGTLASHSELVAMQAAGFTRIQVAISVIKIAVPLALLAMAMSEWVAPVSENMARNYRAQKIYGGSFLSTQSGLRAQSGLWATQSGLWAKDGLDFIYIEHIQSDNELSGVNIYRFDQRNRLQSVSHAATAIFEDNRWQLFQIDESDLSDPAQINGTQRLMAEWRTNLTPDKLGSVVMSPEALSVSRLHSYANYLEQSGQESGRYRLTMWNKLLSPLTVTVMMLMALSFIFGPLRTVPMGVRVLTGIGCGFIFYVLDQIIGPLSLVYGMPPAMGALLPSLLFLLISIYLLLKRR